MDSDHWISRLMAAKRQYALQRAQRHHASPASHHGTLRSDRLGYDDIEPEDEAHSDFPCPYCYEDHDITSLCSHLEDEHPFESKIVRHHRVRRVAGTGNHTPSYAGRDLQDTYLKAQCFMHFFSSAADSNLSHEERERRKRRAAVRSTFVQHLLVTTLFDD
ncbi:hypothetical protein PR202_gb06959 [Eleusine coracana subsp. coracana]|uniref:Di19 zinc-binding domain-containing protein n=1 Tax=Eleusine coracana subsp. coracana TaxID=191504 RepID=A0AAV5EBR0_ELECO|nr:hypothetical protein PR202_gb06959 [Eleusine coracana subsp. coracana]